MANIGTKKNAVEIRSELNAHGVKIEYITINGQKIGILGSLNERDKEAAIKALNDAYIASGGDVLAMLAYLGTIATIEEKGISPDEVIEVCGHEVIISYEQGKAYTMDGEEVADCNDVPNLNRDAAKALLTARAQITLSE